MRLIDYDFNVAREVLSRPFAFKGGAFTEKWLTISGAETASGTRAAALGSLAVLWSDPALFFSHSETGGNLVMSLIAEHALQLLKGRDIASPIAGIEEIFPEAYQYARLITGLETLRPTAALNALVSADNLLWLLHAKEQGVGSFDSLIPPAYRPLFAARQERLVCLPAVTYTFPLADLVARAGSGGLLPKIKIGHPGAPEEMLKKDCARLAEIHAAVGGGRASYSDSGRILYYLDANGRYDSPDTVQRLLDFLDHIDMLRDVLLIEEPYPEEATHEVGDVPVLVAADECLHGVDDVERRISMGYNVITLKAAGKTLSLSFEMARAAARHAIPCIVADSCCVPLLLGWNLNLAARLPALPGLRCGILESNGSDSYLRWDEMIGEHPCAGSGWLSNRDGFFVLDAAFFAGSAGILEPPGDYARLVRMGR